MQLPYVAFMVHFWSYIFFVYSSVQCSECEEGACSYMQLRLSGAHRGGRQRRLGQQEAPKQEAPEQGHRPGCSQQPLHSQRPILCLHTSMCEHGCNPLRSVLVLGDDAKSWDLTTRKHKLGYMTIMDRMVYDESPNIGGVAPLKWGVCLDKAIRIKKDTLRQLA